jgi:hypothetical protein
MWIVCSNRPGRTPLEHLADFLKHTAHGHAELVVGDGVDVGLKFVPQARSRFGRDLDQVVDHARRAEFFFGKGDDLEQFRRETTLVVIDAAFDFQNTAFADGFDGVEHRAVAEQRAAKRAGAVAEFE